MKRTHLAAWLAGVGLALFAGVWIGRGRPAAPMAMGEPIPIEQRPPVAESDEFETGAVEAGDRVYVVGFVMQTVPFDEHGSTQRLRGVTCPELGEPGGAEARAFTQGFLAAGKVWMRTDWTSKLGLHEAEFYREDGASLAAELVRHGYGRVSGTARAELAEELVGLEDAAREAGLGIWAR